MEFWLLISERKYETIAKWLPFGADGLAEAHRLARSERSDGTQCLRIHHITFPADSAEAAEVLNGDYSRIIPDYATYAWDRNADVSTWSVELQPRGEV